MRIRLLSLGLCLLAFSAAAHADDIYTVSFSSSGSSGTYTFLEPSILTSSTTIAAGSITTVNSTNVNPISNIVLNPTLPNACPSGIPRNCVELNFSGFGLSGLDDYFNSPLTAPGTYNGILGQANVTIAPVVPTPVLYTVSFTSSGSSGTYTFLEPSILTTSTTISFTDITTLDSTAVNPISSIVLNPTEPNNCPSGTPRNCVELNFSGFGLSGLDDYFNVPLTAPGTYNGILGQASVTLAYANPVAATPEPGSLALLGTGLIGLVGALRRRLA